MDLARAACRAPLTARKKGSGYENAPRPHMKALGTRLRWSTSFPGLQCEDEGRDEEALVWVGQFCILIG